MHFFVLLFIKDVIDTHYTNSFLPIHIMACTITGKPMYLNIMSITCFLICPTELTFIKQLTSKVKIILSFKFSILVYCWFYCAQKAPNPLWFLHISLKSNITITAKAPSRVSFPGNIILNCFVYLKNHYQKLVSLESTNLIREPK